VDKLNAVLIKTNLPDIDPRLNKEIRTLTKQGHLVTLLCWDREAKLSEANQREKPNDYVEVPFIMRAPIGPKILFFLPIWWFFVFYSLIRMRWDIVHAVNFDTIIPATIAAKIKRKPLIYEMYDTYEDAIKLPGLLRGILIYIDKLFMRLASRIIIVDETRIKEFGGIPNDNISVIYNTQSDLEIRPISTNHLSKFTIFYAGLLNKNRSIEQMIEAVKGIENIELIFAGYGELAAKVIKEAELSKGKIKFAGRISHDEVLKQTLDSSLLFSLYDPIVPLHRYASSNKLFEAMMCSKPILTGKGTGMDEIVRDENCGIIVDCHNMEEIQRAIILLRDNSELCRQLGLNGRRAFEQKYNWIIMEQRLLKLYDSLSVKHEHERSK
jgi:glycosyltransferase involved in cell wall biosynthesis